MIINEWVQGSCSFPTQTQMVPIIKTSVVTEIRPQSPRLSNYVCDFGQVILHPLSPCYEVDIVGLTSQSS